MRYFHSFQDMVYIMGGSWDPDDSGAISYDVITVNLKTGDVGQVEGTISGVNAPAAALSPSWIGSRALEPHLG